MKTTKKALIFIMLFFAVGLFSTAGKLDIVIEQGVTFSRTVVWTDSDGTAYDITDYTVRAHIREYISNPSTIHQSSTMDGEIVLSDPTAGTFVWTIPADSTAAMDFTNAWYDVELESTGGTVTRLLQGNVLLDKEVTR